VQLYANHQHQNLMGKNQEKLWHCNAKTSITWSPKKNSFFNKIVWQAIPLPNLKNNKTWSKNTNLLA
jgi:hypothetical protein